MEEDLKRRKPPTIRASPSIPEKNRAVKARSSLNMSAVPGQSSETVSTDVDTASDFTFSFENDPVVTTSEKK